MITLRNIKGVTVDDSNYDRLLRLSNDIGRLYLLLEDMSIHHGEEDIDNLETLYLKVIQDDLFQYVKSGDNIRNRFKKRIATFRSMY